MLGERQNGQGTILIVDDDAAVLRALSLALKYFKFSTLQANSPEAAIKLWEQQDSKISLLLTDIMMPRQSGLELATFLHKRQPDLKVLLISGYSSELFGPEGQKPPFPFLQKPFPPKLLAATILSILGPSPTELACT